MKPKIKVEWTPEELSFIRENYFKMTWNQLVDSLRKNRSDIEIGSIRHQCVRMGLKKQVQIRWSNEDIKFLQDNYKIMGNIEIAERLNEMKRTYRVIDGEKQYRVFTKKHIEKKLKLLKLNRSAEDRYSIYKRNLRIGKGYSWTKENNAYTLGIRMIADLGEIRKWRCNGRLRVYVKTEQGFISYPRKIWTEHFGPIPKGHNIVFRDGNPDNCLPGNLECISNAELALRNTIHNYPSEVKDLFYLRRSLGEAINKSEKI